jgi:hypothetical protein
MDLVEDIERERERERERESTYARKIYTIRFALFNTHTLAT